MGGCSDEDEIDNKLYNTWFNDINNAILNTSIKNNEKKGKVVIQCIADYSI